MTTFEQTLLVSPIPFPAAFGVADPEVPKSGRPVNRTSRQVRLGNHLRTQLSRSESQKNPRMMDFGQHFVVCQRIPLFGSKIESDSSMSGNLDTVSSYSPDATSLLLRKVTQIAKMRLSESSVRVAPLVARQRATARLRFSRRKGDGCPAEKDLRYLSGII